MTHDSNRHFGRHFGLLALLALGAVAWIPASLHAAAPSRQEKPRTDEILAQGERDRVQKERLEKERAEKARIERQRAESLRRTSAQGKPQGSAVAASAPKPPLPGPGAARRTIEDRREVAKQAARFESKYRSHLARINRLIGIYKAKGDDAHVVQLERMRQRLDVRREHAMQGFRRDLGEPGFQQVQGQVNGKGRRALEERAKDKKESPADKPPGDLGGGR